MKYIVKCPFCGNTYVSDSNDQIRDFFCADCGASNSIEDVVERIDDSTINQTIVNNYSSTSAASNSTGNHYNSAPASSNYSKSYQKFVWLIPLCIILPFVVIFMVGIIISVATSFSDSHTSQSNYAEEKEPSWQDKTEVKRILSISNEMVEALKNGDRAAAGELLYAPENAVISENEKESLVDDYFFNRIFPDSSLEIKEITYDEIKSYEGFSIHKYHYEFNNDVETDYYFYIENGEYKFFIPDWERLVYNVPIRLASDADITFDGKQYTWESSEKVDKKGVSYTVYHVPMMYIRDSYDVTIVTSLGTLNEQFKFRETYTGSPADYVQRLNVESAEVKSNMIAALSELIQNIYTCSKQNDVAGARAYFEESVTDSDIERIFQYLSEFDPKTFEQNDSEVESLCYIEPLSSDTYLVTGTFGYNNLVTFDFWQDSIDFNMALTYRDGVYRFTTPMDYSIFNKNNSTDVNVNWYDAF